MYCGVPITLPPLVSLLAAAATTLAMPKSRIFTKSGSPRRAVSRTFSGFRSRCTMPAWCAAPRASQTCSATWHARARLERGLGVSSLSQIDALDAAP